MRSLKNLFFIMLLALVMIVVVGCGGTKIELSFAKESYTVEVGKELPLAPTVKNEKDEEYKLVYSSEGPTVATYVDGKVKGIAVGETKVKVSLEGNEKVFAEATIKVEEVKEFKVTFNVDGGSAVADINVKDGEKVAKPKDPTKAGFVFAGWYTTAAKTTAYDFNKAVTGALTLYAKWEAIAPDTFTVTFDVDGGSEVEVVQVENGKNLTKPEDPTKEGYTFAGWFTDEEFTNAFNFDNDVITEDITLYAKFDIKKLTVAFNTNGAGTIDLQQVEYGKFATKPVDPTKENYVFGGWFTDTALTKEFNFETDAITATLMLNAKWDLDMTKFSDNEFVLDGGQFPITALGALITADPVASGVSVILNETAAGYYVSATEGSYLTSMYLNDKNSKMAPSVWQNRAFINRNEQGFFEVQLVKTAGSNNTNPTLTDYEYILFAHSAYAAGYNMIGSLQVGQIIAIDGFDITTITQGPLTGATVNIYAANPELTTTKALLEKTADIPVPVKGFHTFEGWFTTADFSGTAVTKAADSGKLYAKWKAEKVNLTFEENGGTEVADQQVDYNLKPIKPEDPTRVGYTFDGWYTEATFKNQFDFDAVMLGHVDLFAKWTALEYDFVFNSNEGSAVDTVKGVHDSKLPAPAEPTREGYEFLGWYTEAEFTNLYDFDTVVTGPMTLYAKWATKVAATIDYEAVYNDTLKRYFIKVVVDGKNLDSTSIKSIDFVREAGKFIAPKALTPDTDTVLWFGVALENANPNLKKNGLYTYLVVDQDDSVYAFSIDYKSENVLGLPFEVSFNTDGGNEVASQIIVKDELATKPEDPTKLGNVFVGWFSDPEFKTEFEFTTPITAITKLYAKWEEIKYTITYNTDGLEIRYGSTTEMFEDLLKDLHTFLESTDSLQVFMHGEGKTTGFAGTWATDTVKAKMLGATVPRPETVDNSIFSTHEDYMDKWLPFFDLMQKYVKAVNDTQNFYGDSFVAYIRIGNFIQNTRPAYASWAPEGWVAPKTFTISTATFELPKLVKDGKVFFGFYDNAEFSGDRITKVVKGTSENLTLYAKFVDSIHKVEFNVNGGSAVSTQDIEGGTVAVKPVAPTKEGFTFVGWFTDEDLTDEYDFTTEVTADLKLYAKWEEVPAVIDYANVSTYAELVAALENAEIKTINLLADITADAKLLLARDGVTINGNNNTLTLVSAEGWQGDYILHVYKAQNVVIKDIKFDGGDAALLVNGATVKLEGTVTLANHEFGGIEVSLGSGVTTDLSLELADGLVLTFAEEAYGTPAIWEDKVADNVVGAEDLFKSTTVKENQVQYYLTEGNTVAPEVVLTVAEARGAALDDLVITQGIVTGVVGNNVFIQDNTGGIYLYLNQDTSFADILLVGNEVKVYGTRAVYNGLEQIGTITDIFVLQTEQTLPEAVVLTELVLDDVTAQQGKLVSIEGLTIKTLPTLGNGHISVTLTNGTVDIVLYTYSYSAVHADVKALLEGAIEGQGINLVAIPVGAFNTTQFIVTDVNQLVLQALTADQIVDALETELDPGTDLVADVELATSAELGGKTYTVTWTSNNEAVVTIAGVVVRPAVGEADALVTLTAAVKDGETVVATLVYDVTVKAETGNTEVESLTLTTSNSNGSYPTSYGSAEWVINGITFTGTQLTRNGSGVEYTIQGNSSRSPISNITSSELGLIHKISVRIPNTGSVATASAKWYVEVADNESFTNSTKYGFGSGYTNSDNIDFSGHSGTVTVTNVLTVKDASIDTPSININVSANNARFVRFVWENGATYIAQIDIEYIPNP